ncbi:hypothetical protein DRF65_10945 [Chryseobacterium pennae]|uniref:CD-NTase associated protein 4-like DNA endonuclease domain-containing protein n=1 Tax=Chryseobacterium pennae TaxID=2258962 RepID=A0A3D9C8N3_9FLAO|nr:hypothetical protein [Chryseobacterium pennae]REC62223.1 hypothetical protein DRF65_10945 [Chryseobacterium pennae]
MSTDATPSWSGYIFQGEVALCKAIEIINTCGADIPEHYCLRLEQDEDFSIKTDVLEVFQVKAYLSKGADKLGKYKDVIAELLNKYHYSKTVLKGTKGQGKIEYYSLSKRKRPIHCSLITDKEITDYTQDHSSFNKRYQAIEFDKFSVIHGVYKLENISDKIDAEINKLFPADTVSHEDIALKRNFCLHNIVNLIKERHRTKQVKSIPLSEIKKWIEKSDIAFNSDLFWITIVKAFLKTLSEPVAIYDLANPNEALWHDKLQECCESLDLLGFDRVKKLIKERINAHKAISDRNLREDFALYMDAGIIHSIITKAIEGIDFPPSYKDLVFDHNDEKYQLSLISSNISDPPTSFDKIQLQGYFKNIQENNLSDVDYIITEQITYDQSKVKDLIRNITDVPDNFSDSTIDITNPIKNYGLKKLSETINDLKS